MSEEIAVFAPDFIRWAEGFPHDVRVFAAIVQEPRLPLPLRTTSAGALNYLLMQLDVVPDHVPVLGLLDDAFVLRVAARLIVDEQGASAPGELTRLGRDDELIRRFLDAHTYAQLRKLVEGLRTREVRKRTPASILSSDKEAKLFIDEVEEQLSKLPPVQKVDDPGHLERELRSQFKAKLERI